ncbi:DUF1223 domain-containing protein [Terriglobus sp.]|uniref:DUF1223 domain-containing protein n=1 Tax=Terriglobus sp. TaxID=1889013 RepID=UPI003AFF7068
MQMHRKQWAALALLAMLGCSGAMIAMRHLPTVAASTEPANAGDIAAANTSAVVVELFTSEGCSSCPPADSLLRAIANTRTDDGQPVVALSEHVTYWNNLGWADPFSHQDFTDRQNGYSARLRTDEVYTPQMVVNGRAQFVGSDATALRRALHAASQQTSTPLRITAVQRQGDTLTVQWHSDEPNGGKKLELWAAVTDDADQSVVARGENGGRTLRHAAVVRALTRVGSLSGTLGTLEGTVRVPLPQSVLQASGAAHHVALLAQEPAQGPIHGAALAAF